MAVKTMMVREGGWGALLYACCISPLFYLRLLSRRATGREQYLTWSVRCGYPSLSRPSGPLLWFHAVSIGEGMAAIPVICRCIQARPIVNILMTTSTVTAHSLLEKCLPPGVLLQFAPVDTPLAVERFLSHWHPQAAVFMESELWPNLLLASALKGSTKEAVRFQILGASPFVIHFAGNLKYACGAGDANKKFGLSLELKNALVGRQIWLAASTHVEEEEAIIRIHQNLSSWLPSLLTIIAPRHPARGHSIRTQLQQQGFHVAQRSQGDPVLTSTDVYIADTLGELKEFYSLAPVAFVGGSLVEGLSGHNLAEAAAAGCVVLTGHCTCAWLLLLFKLPPVSPLFSRAITLDTFKKCCWSFKR
ncbi:hypothetical protein CY35_04G111700 [Sphagnum magellanicum]|nr:hypothetical protein CY35_04G111700 [Sphagnum magellanicum]